ncbi:hypothetical protein MOB30_18110 [Bacillus spizizenii]|nr:hypothetical protein [Bacillus spizizenii]
MAGIDNRSFVGYMFSHFPVTKPTAIIVIHDVYELNNIGDINDMSLKQTAKDMHILLYQRRLRLSR